MNSSTTIASRSYTNYTIIAPISMAFALIAVVISSFILILVASKRQLHTIAHLLTGNTCISSILYCIVQCNNYIYLLFVTWDTSDQSCRWRGYFGYMSIVAVIYSYLLQAISRFIFTVLSIKYRWLTSFKTHAYLIIAGWTLVLIIPLSALLTKDIHFRSGFLCWVPKANLLHVSYTIVAYYLIPIVLIISIYIAIYARIRYHGANVLVQNQNRRKNRDLEVLRNIMILFGIYILGALPSILYMLTGIEFFYSIGIITVSFAVTVEKLTSIFIDREIRDTVKKYICRQTTQIAPMTNNIPAVAK